MQQPSCTVYATYGVRLSVPSVDRCSSVRPAGLLSVLRGRRAAAAVDAGSVVLTAERRSTLITDS